MINSPARDPAYFVARPGTTTGGTRRKDLPCPTSCGGDEGPVSAENSVRAGAHRLTSIPAGRIGHPVTPRIPRVSVLDITRSRRNDTVRWAGGRSGAGFRVRLRRGYVHDHGRRVVMTGIGSFLPNDPVPVDRIDEVLGPIDEAPEPVVTFARRFAKRFPQRSGVEFRHFAIDPQTGDMTHTVATLAEEACRRALDSAGRSPEEVDLLLLSTPLYDQVSPPTTVFLQEALGIGDCVEMEIHANCSGLFKCLRIASDSLSLGRSDTALVVYPQVSSAYLRAPFYNQARMTKTQAALRYILTDGAGAVVLQAVDAAEGDAPPREMIGTFVESVGWDQPPAMTCGAGIADMVSFRSFGEAFGQGSHHVDQDLPTVSREAPGFLFGAVKRGIESMGIAPESVNRLVVSVPSVGQYNANVERFCKYLPSCAPASEFPYRNTGYCGGAAVLVRLDELVQSGRIKPGETVVVHAIESSKWMSGGFALRW